MFPLRETLVLSCLLIGPLAAQAPTAAGAEALFRSVLRTAVDRAQARVDAAELWVDHSRWETAWQVKSAHYVVRTTRSRELGEAIAQGLESMLGHFKKVLKPGFETDAPFTVFVLPNLGAYNQFGDANGAEHSSFYGSFYAQAHAERPVAAFQDPNRALLQMFVTHGAVHQFLDRAFPGRTLPPAMDEGLASYFALYWDPAWAKSQLARFIEEDRFIPLSELLAAPIARFLDRPDERLIELGMLLTYLIHYREDTRCSLDEDGAMTGPAVAYLRGYLAGDDVSQHPVHELLAGRLAELEADFKACKFE